MAGNTTGTLFRLTTFGESHGSAVGGIIDGCPSGLILDLAFIQAELDKRRPGQSASGTQRSERDQVEILSGIFEGRTTGAPIAFLVYNHDQRSSDYEHLKNTYRPSHADFTWEQKYGLRDWRGGGRASARETLARVAGGAIAKMLLKAVRIEVHAWVSRVGDVSLEIPIPDLNLADTWTHPVRCPYHPAADRMQSAIKAAESEGDTLGGMVSCIIRGVPAGLGEPVFDKLHADLGKAMLSINAVKGFEYGSGFSASSMKGSQHNDPFMKDSLGNIITRSNHSGGIQGGISNGMDITFNVAFKPVATLRSAQESVTAAGEKTTLEGKGRHDVCVVPRAVPVVEAMAALVIADHLLRNRSSRL